MSLQKTAFSLIFFGLMAALALAPANFWFCGFVMFVPLFFVLEKNKYKIKTDFYLAYLTTLSFNLFTAYWLFHTIVIYGHIHWTLATIIFILYTLITCSRFLIFFLLIRLYRFLVKQNNVLFYPILKNRYLSWTFFWGLSELFGWQLFHALGANFLGGDFYLLQSADLVGAYGLSVFWFLINLAIYDLLKIYLDKQPEPKLSLITKNLSLCIVIGIIFSLHVYGFFSARYWSKTNRTYPSKKIALVQGNAPLSFEGMRSTVDILYDIVHSLQNQSMDTLKQASEANNSPDLLVWSESSVPFLSYRQPVNNSINNGGGGPGLYERTIKTIQSQYPVPMIINDIYFDYQTRKYYNNLWLLDTQGRSIGYYHKIRLLPFGEFIPFGQYFPKIYDLVPEVSSFSSGTEYKLLTLGNMHILPSICYELLPPDFTLDFFKHSGKKANVIINITNDTWFGESTENAQHIKASALRAIELRLPIIRATNSGISGYIDVLGHIHDPTESFVKDSRIYSVPIPDKSHSVFSEVGYWPFYIFLTFGSIIWLVSLVFFLENNPRNNSGNNRANP